MPVPHIDRTGKARHHGLVIRHAGTGNCFEGTGKMTENKPHRTGSFGPELVDFMARFTSSERFNTVFQEGMGLVEETANYLDGPGRSDARALDRHGSIAYATESMRLTTRLMQLASWLLLQRAVSAGELTKDAAESEKHRINLAEIGQGNPVAGAGQLPAALREIVTRSLDLHGRIVKLDKMIADGQQITGNAANPVAEQLERLSGVFSGTK